MDPDSPWQRVEQIQADCASLLGNWAMPSLSQSSRRPRIAPNDPTVHREGTGLTRHKQRSADGIALVDSVLCIHTVYLQLAVCVSAGTRLILTICYYRKSSNKPPPLELAPRVKAPADIHTYEYEYVCVGVVSMYVCACRCRRQ